MPPLVRSTSKGLYCEAGDFYIDPWQPVEKAVITHGHSDHARFGSQHYLATETSLHILRDRLGSEACIETLPFNTQLAHEDVTLSFHPAGHVLGSAQIRIEHKGEIWVISGDYKTEPDKTCEPFEPVRCHTFITESTFGLPIYHWKPQSQIFQEIHEWRVESMAKGRTCVLFAYPLGKAQRLLANVDPDFGPIVAHGAMSRMNQAYIKTGVALPRTYHRDEVDLKNAKGILVIAPPSAQGSPWLKKFGPVSTAFASGWMQLRGTRRRKGVDRGFALSDHADWPGLLQTIRDTGAEQVLVTHGYVQILVRYLQEQGYKSKVIPTHFEYQEDEEAAVTSLATHL